MISLRAAGRFILEIGEGDWKHEPQYDAPFFGLYVQLSMEPFCSQPHVGEPMAGAGFDVGPSVIFKGDRKSFGIHSAAANSDLARGAMLDRVGYRFL